MRNFKTILAAVLLGIGLAVGATALVEIQIGLEPSMWIAVLVLGGLIAVGGLAISISLTSNPARWAYAYLGAIGLGAAFLAIQHPEFPEPWRGIAIVVGCVVALLAYPRLSPNPGKATLGCLILLPILILIAFIVTGQFATSFFGRIDLHFVEAILILLAAAIIHWSQRRSRASFRALGDRLGFSFQFQKDDRGRKQPMLEGRHKGREVRFYIHRQKMRKGRVSCCGISTPIKTGNGFILQVRPKSQLNRNRPEALNQSPESELQPVSFNDEEFDLTFFVESNMPATAKAILATDARATLLATRRRPRREISAERLARHPILRYNPLMLDVGNGEVSLAFTGASVDAPKLDALATRLDLLCRLADQVEQF